MVGVMGTRSKPSRIVRYEFFPYFSIFNDSDVIVFSVCKVKAQVSTATNPTDGTTIPKYEAVRYETKKVKKSMFEVLFV